VERQPAGVNVAESRYSCMVWYDAAVGDYVAMSPEWGGSAVGVGRSRAAAVQALETLVSRLESAGDAEQPAPYSPTTLAAAVEWERERLARGSGQQGAASRPPAGRRRPILTPT
jgi:hypothetical protein